MKDDWIKRLRLDTDDKEVFESLTENQKKRARAVRQKQIEEEEKRDAMEAEYEASLKKKICTQSLKLLKVFKTSIGPSLRKKSL